ncbi:MAG TPA: DEAD/DEAH box helicase, partial [Oscillatoriaceae cyanobacterium]
MNSLGWPGLRPVQEAALEPIQSGEDVLVIAPTAGGKTEAAMLPLLSRMLEERWSGLGVLYICPIRALLNNLLPRVQKYMAFGGRRAGLWHGDVGQTARKRILADPPELLLTTPESLEAMLIGPRIEHESLFGSLRAVVVDELHAFAGDDRGWHLLALLERLGRIAGRDLQRIGLSATVGDSVGLATWYTGAERPPARVIVPKAVKTSEPEVMLDYVGTTANAATVIAKLHSGEKRLVFCDSRARVEELAQELRGHGVETFVSHGSLGQDERRRAEAAFAEATNCV